MTKAEDLSEQEIDAIVGEVEAAVAAGKIRRVPDVEVMQTRLAALQNIVALFSRDLNALSSANSAPRDAVLA